jgi:predicted outer membrane protein
MRLMSSFVLAGFVLAAPAALFAQQPNDAQIAAIVVTANQVDIDAGKLAESKATSPDVKAFGRQMATDHAGVNKLATDLVTKLGVKPEDNATAQSLKSGGAENVKTLTGLSGAAFDKAYIDRSRSGVPPAGAGRRGQDADPERAECRTEGAARQGAAGVRGAPGTRQAGSDVPEVGTKKGTADIAGSAEMYLWYLRYQRLEQFGGNRIAATPSHAVDDRGNNKADAERQPLAAGHAAEQPDDDRGREPGDDTTGSIVEPRSPVGCVGLPEPPRRQRTAEIQRQRRDIAEDRQLLEGARKRHREHQRRLGQDRRLRRAVDRVNRAERPWQESVARQREDDARHRQRHAAEITEHRNRCADEQERSRPGAE